MDNKHYDLSDYPTDQQTVGGRVEPVVSSATKRYQIDETDGEWFVYDHHDCFCCAGPMDEESAITLQIELNNKVAC